ncbi:MAG: hypothetical protein QXX95_04175 [Nitrososphaerales archaeon]
MDFKKATLTSIASANGIVTYTANVTETTFISGNVNSTTTQNLTRTTSLNSANLTGQKVYLLITVRNAGTIPAVIQTIYFTFPDGTVERTDFTSGNVIPPGQTIAFIIPPATARGFFWSSATNYTVKVVTDTGFTAEGTFASPVG